MAESEERPSKIRKIETSNGSLKESLQAQMNSELTGQLDTSESNTPEAGETSQAKKLDEEPKPALSKSQQKKLLKSQRWAEGKDYRREKRREKQKEKQARKAQAKAEGLVPELTKEEDIAGVKNSRPPRAVQTPVALILDCDFDQYMTEKEIISLGAQVTRCYSENKKSPYRSHLAVSSWGGRMKERFETVLTRNHEGWKGVTFHEDDFMAAAERLNVLMQGPDGGHIAGALAGPVSKYKQVESSKVGSIPAATTEENSIKPKENVTVAEPATTQGIVELDEVNTSRKRSHSEVEENEATDPAIATEPAPVEVEPPSIIYLTSDSPHTLTKLEPNTSYIIGGIVDKNRHKGLCYKRACERGIQTARLPIGDYMTIQGRSVLTINHVVEIMLKWIGTGDWGEAFMSVIPKRKEAKLKVNKQDQQSWDDEDSEDDDSDLDLGDISVDEFLKKGKNENKKHDSETVAEESPANPSSVDKAIEQPSSSGLEQDAPLGEAGNVPQESSHLTH